MPRLIQENPIIDWARGRVQIQRQGDVLQLPVYHYQSKTAELEMVNLCTAKQMVKWFCLHAETTTHLYVIQLVKSKKGEAVLVVPKKIEAGQDVEKTFHSDMPTCTMEVLNEFKDVFLTDLPLGLPPMRKGHEFRIDLEDTTTPVHKPIYKLSPLELEEARK